MIIFIGIFDGSGELSIENGWDGYLKISGEDGLYLEQIVSGDGMEGYEDYQLFLNGLTGECFCYSPCIYETLIMNTMILIKRYRMNRNG